MIQIQISLSTTRPKKGILRLPLRGAALPSMRIVIPMLALACLASRATAATARAPALPRYLTRQTGMTHLEKMGNLSAVLKVSSLACLSIRPVPSLTHHASAARSKLRDPARMLAWPSSLHRMLA